MKSRIRSRSVSTWGLGVKSIDWVLSSWLGQAERYRGLRQFPIRRGSIPNLSGLYSRSVPVQTHDLSSDILTICPALNSRFVLT